MTSTTPTPRPVAPMPVQGLPDPGERVPRLAGPTGAMWFGAALLFAAEAYGVLIGEWSPWLTIPVGAAVTFLMFTVLHESVHHAMSTNTRMNNLFGHLAMPFVVAYAPFPMFKFIHIEHHRNTNESLASDPDAWTEQGPWWQLPFRWATIDLWYLVFWVKQIRHRPRAEAIGTVAVAVVVLSVFAWLITAGYGVELAVLYLIPQRIGLMILSWWFDYLPHHGLTETQRENKYRATRVRVGGERWMTPLFLYQNYHLVHHLHPSVPFYRYIRAWRRNEAAYLDRNAAISTVFGRSLTASEYKTWRRLTDELETTDRSTAQRPVFHSLRVESTRKLTDDSTLITFAVPEDLRARYRYVHGQHITIRAIVDGTEVRRSYSICAPVSAQQLQIAVKQIDGGIFSTYANSTLATGDLLDVMTPTGQFHTALDETQSRRYVAVAAGSGITALMSIVATTLETEPTSHVTLIYGNRSLESAMFADEIAKLEAAHDGRLTVQHIASRSGPDPRRVDGELVLTLQPEAASADAWFLCGPQAMVDDVAAAARAAGVDTERIRTEVFHVEAQTSTGTWADIESDVTVALDGVESRFALRSTGETILDAAMQQGIDAPYSCAGGACGTCRAKVLLGHAAMDQNHALSSAEVDSGYILTCQAHPTSEELRIDYDA